MNKKNYLIAKKITEPLVRETFELCSYTVKEATYSEDINGIDAKIYNNELNKEFKFDIKSVTQKNIDTGFFSFQVYDYWGIHYFTKETEYFSFIDIHGNQIINISKEKLEQIIKTLSLQKGKNYQKYVLIHKDFLLENNDFILYNENLEKSYYEKSERVSWAISAVS